MSVIDRLRRRYWQYRVRYPVTAKPSDAFGLRYIPTIEPYYSDDADFIFGSRMPVDEEVTQRNLHKLTEIFLAKRDACRTIMEIGVCRNEDRSFTHVFLKHKRNDATYLGVDLEDKSFLDDPARAIYTLKADSTKQSVVRAKLRELGMAALDVLFIDGWHSVNAVVNDWRYTDLLAQDGVVIMHDTNCHPGPVCVFDAVDERLFRKQKCFQKEPDWGMAVLQRVR